MKPGQSAFESTDSDTFNEGPNFEIQPLEADLVSSEVARLLRKLKWNEISPRRLIFGVCPLVGCAKIVAFERTLVALQSLNNRWVCQGHYFPAHFDSVPCDTPEIAHKT